MGNSNSSHGEYRIFTPLKALNDEDFVNNYTKPWKDKNFAVEERIDIYIFPLTFPENSDFGLKFRDVKIETTKEGNIKFIGRKLELKVKNGTSKDGVENWNKIIQQNIGKIELLNSHNSPDNGESNRVKFDNDTIFSINTADIIKEITSSIEKKERSDLYIDAFRNSKEIGYAITYKERIISNLEEVYIKLVTFSTPGAGIDNLVEAKITYLQSFCLEGSVTEEDRNTVNEKRTDNTITCGYPEALLKYL